MKETGIIMSGNHPRSGYVIASCQKHKAKTKPYPFTCPDCLHFLRVEGQSACTNTPQKTGSPAYKFLKSLKGCSLSKFWLVKTGA